MNQNPGYPSPNRAYHRGSSTRVVANNGDPQILLKGCPVPPRLECEPAYGLSLVYRVRLAPQAGSNQGQFGSLQGGQPAAVLNARTDWSNAFLIVEHGSGDPDVQRVEFDLMNSDAVPIVGGGVGTVNVYLSYTRIVAGEIPVLVTPDLQIDVSLAVSSCGAMGARSARRTITVGNTTGAMESTLFPVPPYAVGAVLRTNDATAGATITFYSNPIAANSMAIATVQKQEGQSIPVPNAATAFTITTAADAMGVAVMFYLGSG